MTKKLLVAVGIGAVPAIVGYFQPTWALAAQLFVLGAVITLVFEVVHENNKRLDLLPGCGDGSCSWQPRKDFFANLCAHIHGIDPKDSCKLYIYRGYDHGPEEENEVMRTEIKQAISNGRISEFRRVMVVTTDHSIPFVVDWIADFAEEKKLRDKCKFYISFRKNYNLGGYVALDEKCFIAMPDTEPDVLIERPSRTACGVYTQSKEIKEVIHDFILKLQHDCHQSEGKSIHVMYCALEKYVHKGTLDRKGLIAAIETNYKAFQHASEKGDV